MRTILNYSPPTTSDLATLKAQLGYTGAQMADLAGVAGSNQWRKYTGGAAPRDLSAQVLFFIAARLELTDTQLEKIFARMREIGAEFTFAEPQAVLGKLTEKATL